MPRPPRWLSGKESTNAGVVDLIPGSGRSPGKWNGNPLQYFCLGNPVDRGAWQVTIHGVGHNLATKTNIFMSIIQRGKWVSSKLDKCSKITQPGTRDSTEVLWHQILSSYMIFQLYNVMQNWCVVFEVRIVITLVFSHSGVSDSLTPRTVAGQAPLYTGLSRQEYWNEKKKEYWNGLPCPPPGNLPNPGSNPGLPRWRWILYCLSHQGSLVVTFKRK